MDIGKAVKQEIKDPKKNHQAWSTLEKKQMHCEVLPMYVNGDNKWKNLYKGT